MPCEASKFRTARDTIFGRGFVQLDLKGSGENGSQMSADNFCLLMVSEFEIKVLKANQGTDEHSLLIE